MAKKLRVTLVKSSIGQSVFIKKTALALGLSRLNSTIDHPDNQSIRGMLFKVRHLVRVEEIES